GVMILATLLGLAVSIRQIFIHLGPHDSGYGTPFLGMYLYSWSAVGYLIILILIACALIFDKGFDSSYKTDNKIVFALMGILLILIFTNGVSTFIECGWYICPDNPIHYYF
ncbi:MAG: disulfide bond formation protein B, partial [bacterium]|nr:disulfide bond formation protein B [bacterium]